MHLQPVVGGQFCRQFIKREVRPDGDPALHPVLDTREFAPPWIALRFWRKRPGLTLEPHHVIDEFDRNAKSPCRLGMCIALLDKCQSTHT